MRKEQGGMGMGGNSKQNNFNQMDEYENDNGELVQCSMGCGRMFSENIISKHEKVCLKVFQSKRKAFNSAAHRAPEVEGFDKPPNTTLNKTQSQKQKQAPIKEEKSNIPKWKQQSLAFRAGLKQSKNIPMTAEEKKVQEDMDTRVQCQYCGRKFEELVAQRHIPFC